jgi:hypothetical protein
MITLERYCSCGGQLKVSTESLEAMIDFDKAFDEIHKGEAHVHAATAQEAARARRKVARGGP